MLKEKRKEDIKWSRDLAYCVGLLVSDGNLSKDKRHIVFVSKDLDLVETFRACLKLKNKISHKKSGYNSKGKYYFVQFGNVKLYRWLNDIGIKPNKSKNIGRLPIPHKYLFHFLRGLFDGDGCISSFKHPESKQIQFKIRFHSASKNFLFWLRTAIYRTVFIKGKIETGSRCHALTFYKGNSIRLLRKMYIKSTVYLDRKFERVKALTAGVAELAQA